MPRIGFQTPARTETEGGPSGPPFFGGYRMSSKPFLNYDEQVNNLVSKKNLCINDADFAKSKLKEIGYFTLIGGYKRPIKNLETRKYYDGVSFEDIIHLYQFDNDLRELSFKYICKIEIKLRSCISYVFCEEYGSSQAAYLDKRNYCFKNRKEEDDLDELLDLLKKRANKSNKEYIIYQRRTHGEVPFWVILNSFPFGTLLKIFTHLPQKLQTRVSKNFPNVKNSRDLEKFLNVARDFRNSCAHNEQLYLHKSKMFDLPDTTIHLKMNIEKIGTQYKFGKNDYFSLVILFRYLLSADDSFEFVNGLSGIINRLLISSKFITQANLYPLMGLPSNWNSICTYDI